MAYDEALADQIRARLQAEPDVVPKQMFGGLAFLVGGHMAVCATRGGLMVRCDPAASAELVERPEAERMVTRGRELDGWLLIGLDAEAPAEILDEWVAVGVAFVKTLPPPEVRRSGRRR